MDENIALTAARIGAVMCLLPDENWFLSELFAALPTDTHRYVGPALALLKEGGLLEVGWAGTHPDRRCYQWTGNSVATSAR